MRVIPQHIMTPDYHSTGVPLLKTSRLIKTKAEIERMRTACRIAAEVRDIALDAAVAGVTTNYLDDVVYNATIERGAYPSPLNYTGFPKSVCTSVNDVICHGIPDDYVLKDGDIVNCDITVFIDGMHGDCSATKAIGKASKEVFYLLDTTEKAMYSGISTIKAGSKLVSIAEAIDGTVNYLANNRLSIVRHYTGHGIGPIFHMAPHVYHTAQPVKGVPHTIPSFRFEEGMTITVEPMLNLGTDDYTVDDDGWTVRTLDGKYSAQFEHTILVTRTGYEILTKL